MFRRNQKPISRLGRRRRPKKDPLENLSNQELLKELMKSRSMRSSLDSTVIKVLQAITKGEFPPEDVDQFIDTYRKDKDKIGNYEWDLVGKLTERLVGLKYAERFAERFLYRNPLLKLLRKDATYLEESRLLNQAAEEANGDKTLTQRLYEVFLAKGTKD